MLFWLLSLVTISISSFLFFDEEPLFDITDLNVVHVFLIIICFFSVVWENMLKSKYGQYLLKDQSLLFAFSSYWFVLENYIYLVVIVFCFHCLVPLEAELFELVEIYSCVFMWYSNFVFPYLVVVSLLFSIVLFLNYNNNWLNKKLSLLALILIFIVLVIVLFFMIFDFYFNSLTSLLFSVDFNYSNNISSLSYNYNNNEFDWHKTKKGFFIVRFEDLYLYFLQLLNIVSMLSFMIILFFFIFDSFFLIHSNKTLSFTFYGVVIRFFENFLIKLLLSFFLILLVALRITFKYLIEFNFFIF